MEAGGSNPALAEAHVGAENWKYEKWLPLLAYRSQRDSHIVMFRAHCTHPAGSRFSLICQSWVYWCRHCHHLRASSWA